MMREQFNKPVHSKYPLVPGSAFLLAVVGALVAATVANAAPRAAQTWYVSASAAAGGNGSANAPFNSLAAVQQVYGAGDTIMIEPSPVGVPPLNGGIALLPGQHLIGDGPPVVQFTTPLIPDGPPVAVSSGLSSLPQITNTTTYLSGDAVELASNTSVENLVIAGALRGGIYGEDTLGVSVIGNDVSGFNTSGTTGFCGSAVLPRTICGGCSELRSKRASCRLGRDSDRHRHRQQQDDDCKQLRP